MLLVRLLAILVLVLVLAVHYVHASVRPQETAVAPLGGEKAKALHKICSVLAKRTGYSEVVLIRECRYVRIVESRVNPHGAAFHERAAVRWATLMYWLASPGPEQPCFILPRLYLLHCLWLK
jgi:hypothetical protein